MDVFDEVRQIAMREGVDDDGIRRLLTPTLKEGDTFDLTLGNRRAVGAWCRTGHGPGARSGGWRRIQAPAGATPAQMLALAQQLSRRLSLGMLKKWTDDPTRLPAPFSQNPLGPGGGKTVEVVGCDPSALDPGLRRLIGVAQGFALAPHIGNRQGWVAPDANVGPDDLLALSMGKQLAGNRYDDAVGGLVSAGSVAGKVRVMGTGLGALYAAEAVIERLGLRRSALEASVIGYGSAGGWTYGLCEQAGLTFRYAADADHAIEIGAPGLHQWALDGHSLASFPDARPTTREQVMQDKVDVLFIAQIDPVDDETASTINAQVVICLTNECFSLRAVQDLQRRGILVISWLDASVGGTLASYLQLYHPLLGEHEAKAAIRAYVAYRVNSRLDLAERRGITPHEASLVMAIRSLAATGFLGSQRLIKA
jgi:glutamate dehydrogenase/leucine dehydrogenase